MKAILEQRQARKSSFQNAMDAKAASVETERLNFLSQLPTQIIPVFNDADTMLKEFGHQSKVSNVFEDNQVVGVCLNIELNDTATLQFIVRCYKGNRPHYESRLNGVPNTRVFQPDNSGTYDIEPILLNWVKNSVLL